MAQSRKKAIMEHVQKQRRRNRAITLGAIAVIGVVIVAVAIALPRTGNAVTLPGYLDRCVAGSLLYHSHPGLTIVINGSTFSVPPDVGRSGACNRPIHTHPLTAGPSPNPSVFDGTLHIETDADIDYHLGDFFLIWGNSENNANLAIFNSNQIFGNHVVQGHHLNMTVNGTPHFDFQNLPLPRNAQPNSSTAYDIVITYA